MRIFRNVLAAAILIFTACIAAQAATMRFRTPQQLRGACVAAGGSYSAPGVAGVYSCQLKDGAVIACGGRGGFARSCETGAPRTILNPILLRSGVRETRDASRAERATY